MYCGVSDMKEFTMSVAAQAVTIVDDTNTARMVQSGSLDVFSTPMMIALMEQATCKACEKLLDDGETSVGTKINVTHDRASGMGQVITANAELSEVDGRRLVFCVSAADSDGNVIGKGEIERFVVVEDKFMRRVNGQ